jgi:hypothetical protein
LINCVDDFGYNLEYLCLEACSEKDPFQSRRGLATLAPTLVNLKYLRFEGIPLGSMEFGLGGDMDIAIIANMCKNLRAVSIDFCDITMASFYAIWNSCENLEFLGLAGVTAGSLAPIPLVKRTKIKTLRFVDCQIDDRVVIIN